MSGRVLAGSELEAFLAREPVPEKACVQADETAAVAAAEGDDVDLRAVAAGNSEQMRQIEIAAAAQAQQLRANREQLQIQAALQVLNLDVQDVKIEDKRSVAPGTVRAANDALFDLLRPVPRPDPRETA